jgi:hypothetical protein
VNREAREENPDKRQACREAKGGSPSTRLGWVGLITHLDDTCNPEELRRQKMDVVGTRCLTAKGNDEEVLWLLEHLYGRKSLVAADRPFSTGFCVSVNVPN